MYVLVAYDVCADRTEAFRKLLSRYLVHEQRSVFAGNLTASDLKRLRSELAAIAQPEDDVMEVVSKNRHNVEVSLLRKNAGNGILEAQPHMHHIYDTEVL